MPTDDAKSDRTAVVLSIEAEARKPDFSEKRFDDLGCLVEGVGECRRIRHVRVAESRIIRSDHCRPAPVSDCGTGVMKPENREGGQASARFLYRLHDRKY